MTTERWCLWAKHEKVNRWLPIVGGLTGQKAVDELNERKDRARRSKEPVRFRLVHEGGKPDD